MARERIPSRSPDPDVSGKGPRQRAFSFCPAIARARLPCAKARFPFIYIVTWEDERVLGLTMDQLVPLQTVLSTLRVPVKRTNPRVKPSGRIVDV